MKQGLSRKIKNTILASIILLVSSVSFAAGPVSPFVRSINGVAVINFAAVNTCQKVYQESQNSYFPTQMRVVDSSDKVFQELLNYNLNSFFNQDHLKTFKKQTENLSEGFSSNYKSEDGHSMSFKVDAIRSDTVLSYTGLVEAKLSYKMSNKLVNFELSKSLDKKMQLVFTHTDHAEERSDLLALRVHF
ncbi:MAG: hypothetical protein H6625_06220 [Bdellovibrionaceae bacterium]|nr:hypothetical protein [Pseudobdellovibrionaceae bacterium]